MSSMDDFQAGQLVADVKQLTKDVETLTEAVQGLTKQLQAQQIVLAKGKGAAAGVIFLAAILGGIGSFFASKIFGA